MLLRLQPSTIPLESVGSRQSTPSLKCVNGIFHPICPLEGIPRQHSIPLGCDRQAEAIPAIGDRPLKTAILKGMATIP
ncbi:hypothetical protein J0895_01625 [Phormidium pseudopriestleyi FRX01]|uniref:Uncharacterized protein n=1 Tax=Phormidium pseudopriestleyi FRX01 TaxID=1759528 RepID=A0ABS3FLX1_9CYAN|nr:hypothetical protein [Phormidium pseudopriestleyi]MBO0347828.1 hypothetical protein [Phormidium pseudopriestleyi FRX01]